MARQEIDLTTPQPNGKMGEPTKSAWEKVNDMTEEIYSSPGVAGMVSGESLLVNCGIPINQRGFAGGAISAGYYGYDRWKAGAGGCNLTINPSTGVFSHVSGAIVQIVESPIMAWGQPLTFSVENPSSAINVSVGGTTGTIPAGTGRIGVTLTPSGSGNMSVQISASSATYSRPKLERGNSATPFKPIHISSEIEICKRYFEKSYNYEVTPGTVSTVSTRRATLATSYLLSCPTIVFSVLKRASPTVLVYAPTNGVVNNYSEYDPSGTLVAGRPASIANVGQTSFDFLNPNGTGVVGNTASIHFTAESEL
jgi:hypothetical protein